MKSGSPKAVEVRELTGLYGPFFLGERQIQRIWAARAFQSRGLVTRSGSRLEILDPGRWNFQEGPDFRDAVLELDGRRRHGDVEIHVHERDWLRHGHGEDPRYDGVLLHVVLFPDRREGAVEGEDRFETLEWLPHLDRDLEAYLDDLGVGQLADEEMPEPLRTLAAFPVGSRGELLHRAARERWSRKLETARRRLEADGWVAACHQVILETLGLRRNRAVMSRIACEEPIERWMRDPPGTALRAWERHTDDWNLSGCRPANHPLRRLEGYADWIASGGNRWKRDIPCGKVAPSSPLSAVRPSRVAEGRKALRLKEQEERLRGFFQPAVGGTRFNTWVTDGLLPLVAAHEGKDQFRQWFLWPVGDIPDRLKKTLKRLGVVGPGRALCNGWTQGVLRMLEPDFDAETAFSTPPASETDPSTP